MRRYSHDVVVAAVGDGASADASAVVVLVMQLVLILENILPIMCERRRGEVWEKRLRLGHVSPRGVLFMGKISRLLSPPRLQTSRG